MQLFYLLGSVMSGGLLTMIIGKRINYSKLKKMKLETTEEIKKALEYANGNVWNGKVELIIKILDDIEYSVAALRIDSTYKIDLVSEAILNLNPYLILKDDKIKALKNKPYTMVLTDNNIVLTYDFRAIKLDYTNKGMISC